MDKYKDLPDQIWTTRISRVNAERRLIKKESFFQGINIYYSCLTIIFSILALINKDDRLSLMTVFMTVSLLIVILYLNGQKYLEHAREYRRNYTELQKLEFDLKCIDDGDIESIKTIYTKYCDLLDSSSNHISFDYYETIHGSSGEYKKKRWKNVRGMYYWSVGWRLLLKGCVIILPVALYVICEVL
ncbi:MAG: SLATT domain-containing protein [Lachnospiraceae bacterium]|nr:SLATT domain-containing protein [Lachnospiraceae bacterium]